MPTIRTCFFPQRRTAGTWIFSWITNLLWKKSPKLIDYLTLQLMVSRQVRWQLRIQRLQYLFEIINLETMQLFIRQVKEGKEEVSKIKKNQISPVSPFVPARPSVHGRRLRPLWKCVERLSPFPSYPCREYTRCNFNPITDTNHCYSCGCCTNTNIHEILIDIYLGYGVHSDLANLDSAIWNNYASTYIEENLKWSEKARALNCHTTTKIIKTITQRFQPV